MSRKVKNNRKIKLLLFLVISLFITFFSCVNVKAYYRRNVNTSVFFGTTEYTPLTFLLDKTIYASGNNSTTVELTINNSNNYNVNYTLSFSNTNATYLIDGASSTTYTVNGSESNIHVINITGATGDSIVVSINSVSPYSETSTKTINFDASNPAPTISGGTSAKQTAQTFNLSCTDNIGVVGYYFGTTEPSSTTTFTAVTSTTSWTSTGSANSAATYWLGCKDAVGNIGKTSVVVRSLVVHNMFLKLNGSKGTYNTTNYDQSNNPTYYVKNGVSFTQANMCTTPTGGSLVGYKEISSAPGTTAVTDLVTSNLTVNANKRISCWNNRQEFTVTVSKPTNGSIKAETITQTGNSVTASSSAQTLTVRYGDTVKGTATANTGWHFNGWSGGYLTANTTNPSTGGAITENKTITGAFTGNTYTLTYSNATATGATVPSATSCTVTSGSSCNVTLANSGYSYSGWTFNGWGTANNSTSGDAGGTSVTLTGNTTRYATWKKNAITYTLTYSNATATGATVPSATSCTIAAVYNGATQGTSCNVTLASSGYSYSGWIFNGWGTANNSTSGDAGGTSVTLTGNVTRYATWKKNAITYTVSFSNAAATGATVTSAQVSCTIPAVYNGATQGTSCNVALPTSGYSYSGWTFNGWGTGTTSTSGNTGTIAISSTHTRYATWKKNAITYTVSFSNAAATGATVTSDQVSCTIAAVYNGATQGTSCNVTLPTSGYSYSGWTFNGWGTANNSTSGNTGTIAISSTHTRYATWRQTVTRTASYNGNGNTGGSTAATSCTFTAYNGNTSGNCNVTLASNGFTKSGYYFTKWAIDSASGTQSDAGASVSIGSNKTFYAIWTSYTLTLRYNVNGGTITTGTGSERWRASSSLVQRSTNSGSSWTTITAVLNATTTDYDLWNVGTYGATKTGYTINSDSAYNTKEDGTGVNINQQNTSSNTTNAVTIARINGGALTSNKTIDMYIKWVETTATLTYNANGCGTAPSNVTMKYTTATNAASSMTMASGWTFTGWNTASGGNGTAYAAGAQVKAANVVPSAITLYAQCRKSTTRTASYNANGGTGTTNSTTCTAYAYNGSSTYGSCNVTLASNGYSKTGYNFSKWAIDSASGTQYSAGGSVSISADKTFYAVWSEKTATLTYNANGCGTAPSNVTMKYTTATNAASSMTMASGWTLTGWNTASGGNGTAYAAGAQVKAANVVPSAITLYAQCRKSTTRTASYNANGGTGTTNSTTCTAYAYNGSSTYGSCNVTLASNGYSKTGYNFSKWAIDSASGTQYSAGGSVSISANKTFYAVWSEKTATLTYNANGCGTAPSNVTMKYTTATNAASSMSMASGWTLTGWNTASGGNGTAYAVGAQVKAANVVPSAITLYAQCRKGTTRTLTYNGNENTGGATAASTCTAYAYNGSSTYGGCNVALASNGFTRTGHTFTKWAADSSAGIQYNVGEAITLNSNRTFYAKWAANSYTLILAGAAPIATSFDGQTVTLAGNVAVPVFASSTLNLATGTSYTVSFDYVAAGGSNQFDVDFYPPDALPQTNPTATTTAHHRDWVTSSTNSGMTNCTLRFFDDFQGSNEQDITITNIMLSQNTVTTKTYGSTYGTLPTPTRSGYTFKGWFTAEEGGSQVSSSTQITGDTTWYARWEKNAPAIKWRWRATCSCHAASVQSKYVYSGFNFNTSDEAYFNCNNAGAGLSACITWCSNIGGTGASASQCLGMSNAG